MPESPYRVSVQWSLSLKTKKILKAQCLLVSLIPYTCVYYRLITFHEKNLSWIRHAFSFFQIDYFYMNFIVLIVICLSLSI